MCIHYFGTELTEIFEVIENNLKGEIDSNFGVVLILLSTAFIISINHWWKVYNDNLYLHVGHCFDSESVPIWP